MSGRIRICTAVGRARVGAVSVEPPDKESGSGRCGESRGGVSPPVLTKLCGLPGVCSTQSDERGRAQTWTHTHTHTTRSDRELSVTISLHMCESESVRR